MVPMFRDGREHLLEEKWPSLSGKKGNPILEAEEQVWQLLMAACDLFLGRKIYQTTAGRTYLLDICTIVVEFSSWSGDHRKAEIIVFWTFIERCTELCHRQRVAHSWVWERVAVCWESKAGDCQ